MRAFVTGSTGLLGSNLVAALVAAGGEVVAVALRVVRGDLDDVVALPPHQAGAPAALGDRC